MSERPVIYTAIFGGKNELIEPKHPDKRVDYVCFSDEKLTSAVYDVVVCNPSEDPVRAAKKFKMLPHLYFPDNTVTLYIDGSIGLQASDMKGFIDTHLRDTHFTLFNNPERASVKEEVDYCIARKKDDADVLRRQYEAYRKAGFPDDRGLINGSFLLRKSLNEDVLRFNERWWVEIQNRSRRDEVSFPYTVWETGFQYTLLPYHSRHECPAITVNAHKVDYPSTPPLQRPTSPASREYPVFAA